MGMFPLHQLASVSLPLKKEFKFFSPMDGIIFYESHSLLNYHDIASPGPIKSLIKEIFNKQNHYYLNISQLRNRIGYYLSPQLLGKIRAFVFIHQDYNKNKLSKNDLATKLKDEIFKDSTFQHIFQENRNEIMMISKKMNSILKNRNLNELDQIEFNNFRSSRNSLKKYLDLKEDELPLFLSNPETFINKKFIDVLQKSISLFSNQLISVIKSPLLPKILNSILWIKVVHKNDFLSFYNTISQSLEKEIIDKTAISVFLNDSFLAPILSQSGEPFHHLSESLFYRYKMKMSPIPNLIPQGYGKINSSSFTDCGETTLRNFIRLLTDQFGNTDISFFKKVNQLTGNVSPDLIQFFQDFPNDSSQLTEKARIQWDNLVSNIPGVLYRNNDVIDDKKFSYEISGVAGQKNALAVINGLLGLPYHSSWEDLFTLFQQHLSSQIQIIETNFNPDDSRYGSISFSSMYQGNFKILFSENHFEIVPIFRDIDPLQFQSEFIELYSGSHQQLNELQELAGLFPQIPEKEKWLQSSIVREPQSQDYFLSLIPSLSYSQSLDWLHLIEKNHYLLGSEAYINIYKRLDDPFKKLYFLQELDPSKIQYFSFDLFDGPIEQCQIHYKKFPMNPLDVDHKSLFLKLLIYADQHSQCESVIYAEIKKLPVENQQKLLSGLNLDYVPDTSPVQQLISNLFIQDKWEVNDALESHNHDDRQVIQLQSMISFDQINHACQRPQLWGPFKDYFLKLITTLGGTYGRDHHATTLLNHFIINGHLDLAKRYQRQYNISADSHGNEGITPLHASIQYERTTLTEEFLQDHTINPNVTDEQQLSPLHYATIHNNPAALSLLLKHPKTKIDQKDKKGLNAFLSSRSPEILKRFVQLIPDLDLNQTDEEGNNFLFLLPMAQQSHFSRFFLAHPQFNLNHKNKKGETLFHLLAKSQRYDVFKAYLQSPHLDQNFKKDLFEEFKLKNHGRVLELF